MLLGFILFLLWLIGWFISYYLLSRALMISAGIKNWNNTDRKLCAAISISSWIGAMIAFAILLWFKLKLHLDPRDLDNSFINFLKKLEPK